MSATVRALIIRAPAKEGDSYEVEIVNILPDRDTFTEIIGGWLEGVSPVDGAWHAYIDEEGKMKRLPVNLIATALARAGGWLVNDELCGTVVFLGPADEHGDETDVPGPLLVALLAAYTPNAK